MISKSHEGQTVSVDIQSDICESLNTVSAKVPNSSPEFYRCHYCAVQLDKSVVVRCKDSSCGMSYCRPCLTKQYKYSKKAAKQLPTATWRCPKCTGKCYCLKYSCIH